MLTCNFRLLFSALLIFLSGATSASASFTPGDTVVVYGINDSMPSNATIIGDFKIGDKGFTTDCQYQRVVEKAREKALTAGGNAIKITELKEPDLWSTCYRIKGTILKVNATDHAVKTAQQHQAAEEDDEEVADTTADYAIIYLYRPKNFTGSAIGYDIYLDDSIICRMTNNSKYEIRIHKTGAHKIWAKTEAKAIAPLHVKPGKSYYIRCGIQMGFWVGQPQIILVYPSQGKEEYDMVKGKKEE